jgi:hypothetical protein
MYLALLLPHSMTGSHLARRPQPSIKSAPAGRSARSMRPHGTAVASHAGSDARLPSFWRRWWLHGRRPGGGQQLACTTVSPMPLCLHAVWGRELAGCGWGLPIWGTAPSIGKLLGYQWAAAGLNKVIKKVQPSSSSSISCCRSLLHIEAEEPLRVSVRNSAGRS